jgi:hypothetical protein
VSNMELAAELQSATNVSILALSAPEAPGCISPRFHARPLSQLHRSTAPLFHLSIV